MSLFGREAPPEQPAFNGVNALRECVRARDSKPGALKAIVREIDGVGITDLNGFIRGKNLSDTILCELARVLYGGHVEFDPESRMLRSSNKTPARSFVTPPPWTPPKDWAPMPNYSTGSQFVKEATSRSRF
jgi:hypothetical protein